MRRTALPASLLLLLLPAAAAADILVIGGRPVRATWWEDGNEIVVNPYNSTNHAMTFGVERHPKSRIKVADIRSSETPEEEYCRRAFEARGGDAKAHRDLAAWCVEKKRPELAAREWERAMECDPADAEARRALGEKGVKEVLRRNGKANPALGEILKEYLEADNPATRRVLRERAAKEHGCDLPGSFLERAWRSACRPRGRTDDVPLAFRSDKVKGPVGVRYTAFVPSTYDPLRATPLLVGLHGGGTGGKDGTKVVGSGPGAMNFYTGIAEERGWIVVCPTAIQAPWNATPNEAFLEALLEEATRFYNVDLNRIYLTGHSMGGFGTWHFGPLWAERWAAISPMAGGGSPATGVLKDTQTFIFIFHGADDNVVGPDADRQAAKAHLKNGNDFAYTELNGVGHGCPQEVLQEMAAHFEVKRLAVGRGKAFKRSDEIRSSFLEKVTKEEKAYLGDPEPPDPDAGASKPEAERKRLLAELDLGGGRAQEAAAKFAASKDEDAVKPLSARLSAAGKVPDDVRAAAAKALGGIGSAEALPALERALIDANDPVFLAALGAVEAIGDRKAGPGVLRALGFQAKQFAGRLSGSSMDFSDYEPRCGALGSAALVAGSLSDPATAVAQIRDNLVRPSLETRVVVRAAANAGEDPAAVKSALGRDAAQALRRTGHASAAEVLKALRAACKGDSVVEEACDAALQDLANPVPPPASPTGPPGSGEK